MRRACGVWGCVLPLQTRVRPPRAETGTESMLPVISRGSTVCDEILCKWGAGSRGRWSSAVGFAAFPWPQLSPRLSTQLHVLHE